MLMPAERAMSITEIVDLLHDYDFTHQRRLSFEYIMFKGLNDSNAHAREIVKLLQGLYCRVNLIRFHQIPDVDLKGTDESRLEPFRDYLTDGAHNKSAAGSIGHYNAGSLQGKPTATHKRRNTIRRACGGRP